MDTQQPRSQKPLVISLVLAVIIALGLLLTLIWCWGWWHAPTPTPGATPDTETRAATGPCKDGAANALPAGFSWYENSELGYKFAFPTEWGSVAVTTTPIASETGDYVMGRFSANSQVWFGGNATDYTVSGRDGIPTDLPGYLKAAGNYYTVELWRFSDGATTEPRSALRLIEPPTSEKEGCNTTALMTSVPASEISSVGPADVARFTLPGTSHYYGVNFVLDKPTDALRSQFDKLIASFQLL